MRKMKFISASFFTGMLLVAGLTSFNCGTTSSANLNSRAARNEAPAEETKAGQKGLIMEDDDKVLDISSGYIPYEDLSVNIRASSTTSSTQAIDFTMASQVETYGSSRPVAKYCKFRITDMEDMSEDQLKFDSDKCIAYDLKDEADLEKRLAELVGKTDEETEELRKKFKETHGFIADKPSVTGEVYLIKGVKGSKTEVYVPKTITVADFFTINIDSVGRNLLLADPESAENITKIHIPTTISTISTDAFKGLNDDAKIIAHYAEPAEGESDPRLNPNYAPQKVMESIDYVGKMVPATDSEGNATEVLDEAYDSTAKSTYLNVKQGGARQYYGTGKTFICGVFDENRNPVQPMYMHFDLVNNNGEFIAKKRVALPLRNTKGNYDIISGNGLEEKITVDIYGIGENEKIDDKTIKFSNIYVVDKNDDPMDTINKILAHDTSVKSSWTNGAIKYNAKLDISDFITSFSYVGMASYSGYTNLDLEFHFTDKKYKDLKSFVYADNRNNIDVQKTHHIRFRLGQLHKMSIDIDYENKDGQVVRVSYILDIDEHNTNMTCKKDGVTSLLFKNTDIAPDFNAYKVRNIAIRNLTVWIDIFSESTGAANHSTWISRFSRVDVIPESATAAGTFDYNINNLDITIILIVLATIILYTLGAVGLFFYRKEKYKNDEFKRVRPMKYLKSAISGGLGTLLTVCSLSYIILRFAAFANTVITFNPMDAVLIGLTIVDIIVIGYGIKLLVTSIKTNKERKRNIRLKIDEDVADDGTK